MEHSIIFNHEAENIAEALTINSERETELDAIIHQVLHEQAGSPVNCEECAAAEECDLKSLLPKITDDISNNSKSMEYLIKQAKNINEMVYMIHAYSRLLGKMESHYGLNL